MITFAAHSAGEPTVQIFTELSNLKQVFKTTQILQKVSISMWRHLEALEKDSSNGKVHPHITH